MSLPALVSGDDVRTYGTPRVVGLLASCLIFLLFPENAVAEPPRPHIVIILADDLGWNDVGYHGSDIRTPNIDRLAKTGAQLHQFYVQPSCSPTRTALMTGRYPMRCGMHAGVCWPWHTKGLPLDERLLSDALRDAGYQTAICGKWHLGMANRAYLPLSRGFDHQYGHLGGHIDYFKHTYDGGVDWHRNEMPIQEKGYSTQLIANEATKLLSKHDVKRPLFLYLPFNAPHAPQQAPDTYIDQYGNLGNKQRRIYAGMVSCLDDAIGQVLAALDKRGMRENTLVFFGSDNGGATNTAADNTPLRGHKGQLYEGGVRVPAIAAWPGVIEAGCVIDEPLHVVDLFPTLISLAGGNAGQRLPLDGRDAWPTIASGATSPHQEILLNARGRRGAIRQGPWKLIRSRSQDTREEVFELFDLSEDPNEKHNLAHDNPQKVAELAALLNQFAREEVQPDGLEPNRPANFKPPQIWDFSAEPTGSATTHSTSNKRRS